jgi:hypothetical protein
VSSLPPVSSGVQTPGQSVPPQASQVNPDDPNTWGGPDREDAPQEIQEALRQLVYQLEQENSQARLTQVRNVLQGREFFKGNQVIFWNAQACRWDVPSRAQLGDVDENEYDDLQLVTNLYQGYALVLMAELSQTPPKTAFMPEKASIQADVRLAQAGTDIVQFINRNNKIDYKLAHECWLLFNDASYAEYWRFVRDEAKYGVETYTVEGPPITTELAPDRAECAACQWSQLIASPEQAPPVCPQCAEPMGPASFKPALTEQSPNPIQKTRPAGQEICDVVGMLELALPAYEKNEDDLGFITWCREVHKAKLKAMFPKASEKLGATAGADTSASALERHARLSLLQGWPGIGGGGEGKGNLITFRETWLQPWTFHAVDDADTTKKLLAAYPSGAYCAFAGDVYCASRDEDGRKFWTITHAFPGDGQYRQSIGNSSIPTQRKFNQVDSIERDTYERTIPFMIADTDVFDPNAMGDERAEPGNIYPATARGNKTVSNSIYETKPGAVSEQMLEYKDGLMNKVMPFQNGGLPSLYGGDTGANDTATGIGIERNQARGRVGLIYRAIKDGRARADLKNIEIFRENRTQDVEIAVAGEATGFKAKTINLDDIKGGSVQVYMESDESYPVSLNEQKNQLLTLLNNQNPAVMAWFSDPANEEAFGRLIGMTELVKMPGVQAREKCYDVIEQLLKSGPNIPPPPPMPPPGMDAGGMGPPPMGMPSQGAPMPPAPPEPTVQPDPVLDDLNVYLATCREWAASEAGREAMVENAAGYANVQAFAGKILILTAPPPMPMPPPGATHGGAPSPNGPPPPGANAPMPGPGVM